MLWNVFGLPSRNVVASIAHMEAFKPVFGMPSVLEGFLLWNRALHYGPLKVRTV